jgi:hypothetical protein
MSSGHHFPNLRGDNHHVTSPQTNHYNCIAWAAGETFRRWWPVVNDWGWYWPPDIPRVDTVDAFVAAFAGLGYAPCDDSVLEAGYEKVALYVDLGGTPTHMARQLESGRWTSKLGRQEDIEHDTLSVLEGPAYGRVALYLRRARVGPKGGSVISRPE